MATEVDICNLALSRVMINEYIHALDENTSGAHSCRIIYPLARDLLQSEYPWPFLMAREQLVALVDGARGGWQYGYTLPADLLRVVELKSPFRNPTTYQRPPFKIEAGSYGRILLTDEKDPELVYIAQNSDPTTFPPSFVDALAWKVAMDLALSVPGKESLLQRCREGYAASLQSALITLLVEGQEEPEPESSFITVRY